MLKRLAEMTGRMLQQIGLAGSGSVAVTESDSVQHLGEEARLPESLIAEMFGAVIPEKQPSVD